MVISELDVGFYVWIMLWPLFKAFFRIHALLFDQKQRIWLVLIVVRLRGAG